MMKTVWLASYPKSGNTWFRMLIGGLFSGEDQTVDINDLPERGGIASARGPFDHILMIDSGLLTHDEVDCLRPRVYEALALGMEDELESTMVCDPVRFVKVHDAYTLTPNGEPLLAGARGADGAIVIVRDPRDVASSFANHSSITIDESIATMNDANAGFCRSVKRQPSQLRQKLRGWGGHVASWLNQRDIPVHLVRYEDLHANPVDVFLAAMAFAGKNVSREEAHRAVDRAQFSNLQDQEQQNGFREWTGRGTKKLFFRRGEKGGWHRDLTEEQVARIEKEHAPMMVRLGYELSLLQAPQEKREKIS